MQQQIQRSFPSVRATVWRLPAALAGALLVAGCSHTSNFEGQNTPVAVPLQWAGQSQSAEGIAPAQDISRWWQAFGDMQMTALVEQALQANASVQSAQAALRQARAQLAGSQASLLPNVGASLGSSRTYRESSGSSSNFSAAMDASWEPDFWGTQSNALKASQANTEAAIAALEAAHVALAAEVVQNYIELRNLQNRLRIAQENLAIQQENQQITQWRVQAGLATSLDAEQARQSTAQTAAQLPALQASITQSMHAMAILTGQVPTALVDALQMAKPVPAAPETLVLALPADTLRQRPDVRAQEYKVAAAVANLSAQERANFPSLRLSGSLGVSAATLAALGTSAGTLASSIAASLSQTLFDGGANTARVQERQAAVELARISYRTSVLAALQEVEDALAQLQGDQARLALLQVAEEAARNAQLMANQRYSSGLVDFQVVLDTQRTLLSAQDSLASAQAAISTDYVRLYKALGGGWTPLGLDGQPSMP